MVFPAGVVVGIMVVLDAGGLVGLVVVVWGVMGMVGAGSGGVQWRYENGGLCSMRVVVVVSGW